MRCALTKLTVAVAVLGACSESKRDVALSPEFARVARIAPPEGLSTHLERALSLAEHEPEQALAAALDAMDRGEVLPSRGCYAKLMELLPLAKALVDTAPKGDRAQLTAAIWLAHRLDEANPSLLGAMFAISVAEDAVERLRADGTPPTDAMKVLGGWPSDLVRAAYARQVLCMAERITDARPDGAPGQALEALEAQKGELFQWQNALLARIVALGDRPDEVVAELVRSYEEAEESDTALIRAVALPGSTFRRLERTRQGIGDYFAAAAAEPSVPASIEVSDPAGFGGAAIELALVDGDRGVRVLGIDSAHAWGEVGLANGDVLVSLDGRRLTAEDLVGRLETLAPGRHELVLERGGEAHTIVLVNTRRSAADLDATEKQGEEGVSAISTARVPRNRVSDARRLRKALERSGLDLTWQERVGGYAVSGVRDGTLAADLGLSDGDVLQGLDERSARSAHGEGQGGIGYLVDGLGERDVDVKILRGGAAIEMKWRFE